MVGDIPADEMPTEEMNGQDKDQTDPSDVNETELFCNQSVAEADIDLD